jgi:hypothetical protein
MKVLVATRRTQGDYPDDLFEAIEGELVVAGPECDKPLEQRCPCSRTFPGAASGGLTSTYRVASLRMARGTYIDLVIDSVRKYGFDACTGIDIALFLEQAAAAFPVGSVLSRRGDTLLVRRTGNTRKRKPA